MKEQISKWSVIYLAQIIGLLVFGGVALYLDYNSGKEVDEDTIELLQYPLIVVFIFGLAGSYWLPRQLLNRIKSIDPLDKKIRQYAMVVLVRAACLELPALMSCVVAILTSQPLYVTVIPLVLILFILYWPTRKQVVEELLLNPTEKGQL